MTTIPADKPQSPLQHSSSGRPCSTRTSSSDGETLIKSTSNASKAAGTISDMSLQKEMQSSFLHVPQTSGTYEFHIRDFELLPHNTNQKYISSPFSICGTDKWDMAIIPGGSDDRSNAVLVALRNLTSNECRASCSLFLTSLGGLKFVASTDTAQTFAAYGNSGDTWFTSMPFSYHEAIKSNFEFLINGEMIVVAKMNICGKPEFLSIVDTTYEHPITTLPADLEFLLCQAASSGGMKSDITLVSGDVRVPCHQCILACRSKIFRESFLTSTTAVKLMLHGGKNVVNKIHPSVLREFVHFLYTDQCRPEFLVGDQLAYMFSAACKYQVLGLMAICEKQMEQNLTVANAAHCLSVADHVEAKSLKLACLKFIANHTSEVVASEGYSDLDSHLCRLILGEVSMGSMSFEEEMERQSINPAHTFSSEDEERMQHVHFGSGEEIAEVGSISRESKQSEGETQKE